MSMDLARHAAILQTSFQRWTGKDLLPPHTDPVPWLDGAPFALVSHGTEPDPIFNYANQCALKLFGMTLAEFTALPSRLSAGPVDQALRARLMAQVTRDGFMEGYSGERVGAGGRRFMILDTTIWNLLDEHGEYCGQAALIPRWSGIA